MRGGWCRIGSGEGLFLAAALAALPVGCGEPERPPPLGDFGLGAERTYPGCEEIDFENCYVDDRECQQLVFDAVSCARGLESSDAPDVELVTNAELGEILEEELAAEPDAALDERTEEALVRLGALQLNAEPAGAAEADQGGIAGLYLPKSDRVILVQLEVAETWPFIAVVVLVHEYAHYLQARDFDWENDAPESGSFDEQLAFISTIEGEASVYERAVGGVFAGVDSDTHFSDNSVELLIRDAKDIAATLGLPYSYARLLFPYTHGFAYSAKAWREGGAAGVRALLSDPAQSTREIMTPDEPFRRSEVVDVALPEPPEGWSQVEDDVLGAWVLFGMLAYALEDDDGERDYGPAWDNALGWRGDRFGAYESGDDIVGVWRVEFDSEETASAASEQFRRVAAGTGSLLVRSSGNVVTVLGDTTTSITEEWAPVLE